MKQGYKETSVGVIPEDWEVISCINTLDILSGFPFDSEKFNNEIGLPLIRIRDLKRGFSETLYNGDYNQDFIMKHNDLLIGMDGEFHCVLWKGIPSLLNQRIMRVKSKSNSAIRFIYYTLTTKLIEIHRKIAATTVKHLSVNDIKKLLIPLPPLPEQEKIASILTTVDDKIESIDNQITKATELKKGLMQKLFSEGIGHTEFKDSPVGQIPGEWEVKKLNEVSSVYISNVDKKTVKGEKEIKLCNYMDVYNNRYIKGHFDFMPASASENQISIFTLQKNDVIFTKDSETKEDIAYSTVVLDEYCDIVCGYHLTLCRPLKDIVDGTFLMNTFFSANMRTQVMKVANGSTRFGIGKPQAESLLLPYPSYEEQKKIASILTCADEKITILKDKKSSYTLLKKGLMQKLLTGEIRVTING